MGSCQEYILIEMETISLWMAHLNFFQVVTRGRYLSSKGPGNGEGFNLYRKENSFVGENG